MIAARLRVLDGSGLAESVVLRPGGEDLLFELCGEEGRLALEAPAEPASSAAVSRLGGDPASLGFRRHEPPEDESVPPRVVEGGLAGCLTCSGRMAVTCGGAPAVRVRLVQVAGGVRRGLGAGVLRRQLINHVDESACAAEARA